MGQDIWTKQRILLCGLCIEPGFMNSKSIFADETIIYVSKFDEYLVNLKFWRSEQKRKSCTHNNPNKFFIYFGNGAFFKTIF